MLLPPCYLNLVSVSGRLFAMESMHRSIISSIWWLGWARGAESHLLFWQSKIITVTAFAQDLPKLVKTSLQGTTTTPHSTQSSRAH